MYDKRLWRVGTMKKINLALEAQLREQSQTMQQLRRELSIFSSSKQPQETHQSPDKNAVGTGHNLLLSADATSSPSATKQAASETQSVNREPPSLTGADADA